MVTSSERFATHPVWSALDALTSAIANAKAKAQSVESLSGISRAETIVKFLKSRLRSLDSNLVQPGPFDQIASYLQNAASELNAFARDEGDMHIQAANGSFDALLASVAQLVFPFLKKELVDLSDVVESYRRDATSVIEKIQGKSAAASAEVSALETRLKDLQNEVISERQQLATLSSEHQSQFSTAQDQRSKQFEDAQGAKQDRFQGVIEQYTQALAQQNADFTKQRETMERTHAEELGELKSSYEQGAEGLLARIRSHLTEVEKLVGVIGNLGLTSGYLKAANGAKMATWVWQTITVLALGGVIWVAAVAFVPILSATFTWQAFAGRSFLSLTVGVLAAYAAKQADKYMEIERRNRKLALELEAIGPFLAPLPAEKQETFRLAVGERSFGRDERALATNGDKSPASVVDVVMESKEFRDFVTNLVKAARSGV